MVYTQLQQEICILLEEATETYRTLDSDQAKSDLGGSGCCSFPTTSTGTYSDMEQGTGFMQETMMFIINVKQKT